MKSSQHNRYTLPTRQSEVFQYSWFSVWISSNSSRSSLKVKTAFSTINGHFEFNKMLFGLKDTLATFQRWIDLVLSGLQGAVVFIYMDDTIIYASSLEEHSRKLRNLWHVYQMQVCLYNRKSIIFSVRKSYIWVISEKGVKLDPRKVKAIQEFPLPKNKKNIKYFWYKLVIIGLLLEIWQRLQNHSLNLKAGCTFCLEWCDPKCFWIICS